MSCQVVSINDKIEQQANEAMSKRFHRQASLVRSLRLMIEVRSVELYAAGVLPSVIAPLDKHLRDVYADNKAMALGENIDEFV